jgi:hypothetical protein
MSSALFATESVSALRGAATARHTVRTNATTTTTTTMRASASVATLARGVSGFLRRRQCPWIPRPTHAMRATTRGGLTGDISLFSYAQAKPTRAMSVRAQAVRFCDADDDDAGWWETLECARARGVTRARRAR